ncbi:MAG TPA: glucose-6-phosphate dehydrogenase assembly protein OpcA [Ktedonobacteraceae bacterium]
MANDIAGNPVTRLPWAGKQVRIEGVDTILSSLWKMSADNMRIGANLNVRTSVLNLLICAPDTQSALYASQLLRDLSSTHIARATLVILDQSTEAPDSLESWVTLRCFSMISDLMRHCFEQTTLLVSGRVTTTLSSTLSTVLKAHLPVYLWWIGDTRGADDAVFRNMAELCTRVIVDSATFFQPEQDIHTLASYCKAAPQTALSDLNWGRLTLWRQLMAQFFDGPDYLPFLHGIELIEIEHAAAPLATTNRTESGEVSPNPTAALLLAGWLKASLNMELVSASPENQHHTASATYQWLLDLPSGQQTLVQIRPRVQAGLLPGSLYMVRLTCQHKNRRVIFTIKRDADSAHVQTSVESAEQTRPIRTVNLPDRHKASELVYNELEITVHDQLFEQALQELELLLGGAIR